MAIELSEEHRLVRQTPSTVTVAGACIRLGRRLNAKSALCLNDGIGTMPARSSTRYGVLDSPGLLLDSLGSPSGLGNPIVNRNRSGDDRSINCLRGLIRIFRINRIAIEFPKQTGLKNMLAESQTRFFRWIAGETSISDSRKRLLVISNGMAKSGSSLLHHYTRQLMEIHFDSTCHQDLLKLVESGKIAGVGGFVRKLDRRSLSLLRNLSTSTGPVAAKAHAPLTRRLRKLIESGAIRTTFCLRDPRDMLLSAIDHRGRSIREGNPIFQSFTSVANSINAVKWWCRMSQRWLESELACVFRYHDLITQPHTEIARLAKFLELKIDDVDIDKIIQQEKSIRQLGRNQFNQGKLSRYRQEMTEAEIDLCNAELAEFIEALGYVVDEPLGQAAA